MPCDKFLENLFGLSDRVAIVTGGSRGIGAAIANGLSAAGAHTVAIGRSNYPSDELNSSVAYYQCDVLEQHSFQNLCEQIDKDRGQINVLVNAVGITEPTSEQIQPIESFINTLETNLIAIFKSIHCATPFMRKIGGGSIINITSIGSVVGFPNNPGYVASKGGLRMLSRALAIDLATVNIRVNNIAPGYIHTSMTKESFLNAEKHDARLGNMLINRWGNPIDLIGAAIYLASDASAYVTGSDIFVDGGWTAKGLKKYEE